MSILVTGGAGFIGSHLCERLLLNGKKVYCIDDFNNYYDPEIKRHNINSLLDLDNFNLLEGDIKDNAFLESCFIKHHFEEIIHLAARAGVRPSLQNPLLYAEVNINGTLNLLELARKYKVLNFIFGSSSSVYGNNKKVPFSESDKIHGMISPYAITKQAGENLCFNYNHLYGIPMTCLRFFTVYGPRQRPDMAIYKFTKLIYENKEIPMYGNGSAERDYTFIDDIIDGVVKALGNRYPFEIFNLGESETISLSNMINLIEKSLGKKAKVNSLPMQPGDVNITFADINKAKRMLDYNPKTKIKDGIPIFVDWFLDNHK